MMSAAVHGSVFASPGPATVLAALRAVGHDHPRRFKALFLCICKMNATILCIAALYCMAASPQKVFFYCSVKNNLMYNNKFIGGDD